MCWCNPNIRTPYCGSLNCVPPNPSVITNQTIQKGSQEVLWTNYCEMKAKCEDFKEKFENTLEMLEYSHMTSEMYYDYEKVTVFIKEMQQYLKEK